MKVVRRLGEQAIKMKGRVKTQHFEGRSPLASVSGRGVPTVARMEPLGWRGKIAVPHFPRPGEVADRASGAPHRRRRSPGHAQSLG